MSEGEKPTSAQSNERFPLWVARRWYLYRLHRGASMLALGCTMLLVAAVLPLIPVDERGRAALGLFIACGAMWMISALMIARATKLLVTGAPEHRHSATRLALGAVVPLLGGIAVGSAGVALIALLYGESGLGGRWAGAGVILTLLVVALSMWACGEVASASPRHPRTSLVSLGANLAVILTLVAMALVVLAMMSVLKAGLVSWISSVAVALISASATIAALSARAIVGSVILARETAEIGPEIEPVSGP